MYRVVRSFFNRNPVPSIKMLHFVRFSRFHYNIYCCSSYGETNMQSCGHRCTCFKAACRVRNTEGCKWSDETANAACCLAAFPSKSFLDKRVIYDGNFSRASTSIRRKCASEGPSFYGVKGVYRKAESWSTAKNDGNTNGVRDLVRSDRWLTARMIGEQLRLTSIKKFSNHFEKDFVIRARPNIKNTVSIEQFLATENIPEAPQRPYSPDLSPWDFLLLFPRTKINLNGRRFGTLENIQKSVTGQSKAISAIEFQIRQRTIETSTPAVCGFPGKLLRGR